MAKAVPEKDNSNLKILGARENNLKCVSLEIPHDALSVVTGLSGSGKSSLAFDTVYAEGQRRYIETFSPYTRQFFDKVKKPDCDAVENVRPAVAIQQRTRITSSRATVGSLTNINDYLKLLWANFSVPQCSVCGIQFESLDAEEIAERICALHSFKSDRTLLVCARLELSSPLHAPSAPGKSKKRPAKTKKSNKLPEVAAQSAAVIASLLELGFSRYFDAANAQIHSIETFDLSRPLPREGMLIVLDRVKPGSLAPSKKRLRDSVDQALNFGAMNLPLGVSAPPACIVIELKDASRSNRPFLRILNTPLQVNMRPSPFVAHEFRAEYGCPSNLCKIQRPRPGLFSFNHPLGACPHCKGFGRILAVDRSLCVPNPTLSIKQHALACWAGPSAKTEYRDLLNFCEQKKIPTAVPWKDLSPEAQELIFSAKQKDFWGVLAWFKWLERKTYKMHVRVFLSRYRSSVPCPACQGARLIADALAYRINGKSIADIWDMPIGALLDWALSIRDSFESAQKLTRPLRELLSALTARLKFLVDLGLPYLTLDRQARTLSGGETQRVSLASALGSDLVSTQFVLDEPSVGLHARDTARLIDAVSSLAARGNSVLMVEHDLDCIHAAEHVIELGPAAGERGGEVVYSGKRGNWGGIDISADLTALRSSSFETSPHVLKVLGATARNLKSLSLEIPLERLVCLSGVSGSGKSTLAHEVILKAYERHAMGLSAEGGGANVQGFEHVEEALAIDQSALAKSPRANIATYSGIWDRVRELLADTPDAHARALPKSAFSFNVDGGRCPECQGAGFIREDMQFLSDVYVPCEVCLGRRFQPTVLDVLYRGKSVADLLHMSVEHCLNFFSHEDAIAGPAGVLCELGLGHLTLGHSLSELSGGEAQRLKLVPIITESGSKKSSLLVFDEPTTGLHFADVQRLIALFRRLRDRGHSILCIEHNLSVLLAADWIIELGPEGGADGGQLLLEGPPSRFLEAAASRTGAPSRESHTAKFLREYFSRAQRWQSKDNRVSASRNARTSAPKKRAPSHLTVRGAREHNLKNISVDIPLRCMVAVTGVSGSGKSTIAKDIVYAEGQRRYLDCLSPYARQYIKELKKPDIEDIKNVLPSVCVYQHTFQPGALSTVATMSEVYHFLRLLYAKSAQQFCPDHPTQRIAPLSVAAMAQEIKNLSGAQVRILAPVVKLKKGTHRAVLERALQSEVSQLRIDGVFLAPRSINPASGLEKSKPHTIEFVVGRFNPRHIEVALIEEAVTQALSLSAGTLIAHCDGQEFTFSTERTCPECKRGFFKPDPEDLSFNSRRGRCPRCEGSGVIEQEKGGDRCVCPECAGARIGELGRNLRLLCGPGVAPSIDEICKLNPSALLELLPDLSTPEHLRHIAEPVLRELRAKLQTLVAIGLDYLPLSRDCRTLSGGELQRLRLATAMGSSLSGAMYIFDEPSAGLHPSDNELVLNQLRTMQDKGNSVLVIEHDPESIRACDYVIDVGPGAGLHGGTIVYAGPLEGLADVKESATAAALSRPPGGDSMHEVSLPRSREVLTIEAATCNNIRNLSLEVPLHQLVCIAGVSGSGKSSLVHRIIAHGLRQTPDTTAAGASRWRTDTARLSARSAVQRVIEVDQKPIGLNSRSTPASYLKIWDQVRILFASSQEARVRGWGPSFFSYNSGKGRCAECKGLGFITLAMSFLPDAQTVCESCGGSRYSDEAQSIRYLGISPSEALRLTFEEAKSVFANHRSIHQSLRLACELGLGYLALGQSSTTLSGGESQRLKLVAELAQRPRGHTLYILDEPTTGLHRVDVKRLMKMLREFVMRGDSVMVIEHDEEVVLSADYVIELGPGPAERGGTVIYAGEPSGLVRASTPWGEWLRGYADRAPAVPHTQCAASP